MKSYNAPSASVRKLTLFCLLLLASGVGMTVASEATPPAWAYPVNPPDFKPSPDDGELKHVPGSSAGYKLSEIRDLFVAPDWHPEDHGPMPEVVMHGRKPQVYACGCCHRADGPGGPENSSLAGLPVAYIIQQVADFKSGARKTSVPQRGPTQAMTLLSTAATDAEVAAAAAYFSALKPKALIRVVETQTVPKTYVAGWFLAALKTGETEPIGQRIIEVPEDVEQFERRDTHSRFVAHVPVGSLLRGQALADTGVGGKTIQCRICHGPDLKGLGPIPAIAGRSPSYIFRQLYDFKAGNRAGIGSALMKPTVANLTPEDMLSLAAYTSSLAP
ncbi:MAG: cytochrome C-binding protein [Verrucomicrobiota bacterium]